MSHFPSHASPKKHGLWAACVLAREVDLAVGSGHAPEEGRGGPREHLCL
jgi:hypothetical protein